MHIKKIANKPVSYSSGLFFFSALIGVLAFFIVLSSMRREEAFRNALFETSKQSLEYGVNKDSLKNKINKK